MDNKKSAFTLLLIITVALSGLAYSAIFLDDDVWLHTLSASFRAPGYWFDTINVEDFQVLLNGTNVSASSSGITPNITIINFFNGTIPTATFDVNAQIGEDYNLNVNTSSFGRPNTVTSNISALTENVDWFYFPLNTSVRVNGTFTSPIRIEFDYGLPHCEKIEVTNLRTREVLLNTTSGRVLTLDVTINADSCAAFGDFFVFLKNSPPQNWNYHFDCPGCVPTKGKSVKVTLSPFVREETMQLIISIPTYAPPGRYNLQVSSSRS